MKSTHLFAVIAITMCFGCFAQAAPSDSTVVWKGASFLDEIYKQVDGRSIRMDIDYRLSKNNGVFMRDCITDEIGADVTMITVKNSGHNWRNAGGTPTPGVAEIQEITAKFALEQVQPK